MKNPSMLSRILNVEKWQKLQDSLALITGLAIITVDYKGIPITKPSSRRAFCDYIRNDPELYKRCQKCDARGGLEATRLSQPYIYKCHCDIVNIAIPIIVNDQYMGAIMAGEVKISNPEIEETLERIISSATTFEKLPRSDELILAYKDLPLISNQKLRTSVQLLFELCNYLVEEALNKKVISYVYENLTGNIDLLNAAGIPADPVRKIRNKWGSAFTNPYFKSTAAKTPNCSNKTLKPAFEHMYQHKNIMLSQKDAAELCHISTGHFSRLFFKETNENYSVFYMRLKIEWAKNLLVKTDWPIAQISEELGFNEPSYFTKVFHKFEDITPAYYRRTSREKESFFQ